MLLMYMEKKTLKNYVESTIDDVMCRIDDKEM